MAENEKKHSSRQIFRSGTKGKKTECADIVTQAENVINAYINKRKNEIIDKYCKKPSYFKIISVSAVAVTFLCYIGAVLK